MKKMMFLTLALSVMAMGSAMANDSAMDKNHKPNKVKVEINHNCCGDHGGIRFEAERHHNHNFHKYNDYRKSHRGKKFDCPICEYKAHKVHKGNHKRGYDFDGKRPGGRPEGNRGNGFYSRPGGRH